MSEEFQPPGLVQTQGDKQRSAGAATAGSYRLKQLRDGGGVYRSGRTA
jgi:hypothetical protein